MGIGEWRMENGEWRMENGELGRENIDFIDQCQHDWLITKIDTQVWDNFFKRRTQHYGWQYRYDRRLLTKSNDYLGLAE